MASNKSECCGIDEWKRIGLEKKIPFGDWSNLKYNKFQPQKRNYLHKGRHHYRAERTKSQHHFGSEGRKHRAKFAAEAENVVKTYRFKLSSGQ